MEALLNTNVNWSQLLIAAFLLLVLYFLLRFTCQILENTNYFGKYRLSSLKVIKRILLFYEPLVLLILTSIFVLIRPPLHGLWVLLIVIGGFSHIRNYISGRILQLDQSVALGTQIKFHNQEGVISQMDRLGLQLKSDKGTHHINYSRLMAEGFMKLSGEEIGGYYYNLHIQPKTDNTNNNHPLYLNDLMTTTPYLDWNFKPSLIKGEEQTWKAKIMVREEEHIQDLKRLIEEWGYDCQIV